MKAFLGTWICGAFLLLGCGTETPAPHDAGYEVQPTDTKLLQDAEPDATGSHQASILGISETEQWTIPGLTAPVHVVRVEMSIPHIYAENTGDLGRVLGFTVARDRYFIMDLQRRLGRGNLSALLGDLTLG